MKPVRDLIFKCTYLNLQIRVLFFLSTGYVKNTFKKACDIETQGKI